jgi:hypothetical protein
VGARLRSNGHSAATGRRRDLQCWPHRPPKDCALNIHVGLAPIISLLAGILILAMPRLLNYIVAVYLIVIGLIGLFGGGAMRI